MKNAGLLEQLCRTGVANPDFQPRTIDGVAKTFCNYFANYVACGMGCTLLSDHIDEPILADSIYDSMLSDTKNWREINDMYGCPSSTGAAHLASQGSLVFGILNSKGLNQEHGHINVVVPGECQFSGHWNMLAPLCANVGVQNFYGEEESYAFRKMPKFIAWVPSL